MTETLEVADVPPVVLKHPHANCDGCPLYEVGTYVPSTFPSKACSTGNQLAFVGEAPGENEIKEGKPFIGMSGKVLSGTLQLLDIDRDEALVSNASACHYPAELFDKLPKAAVEHCRPRLIHELEAASVQTAVTLGAHAAASLLNTREGITLSRAGGPRPSDYVSDLLVVPTFHPAYALRNHSVFPLILSDVRKVNDGIWNKWPGVKYRVIRTDTAASQEIYRLWNLPVVPIEVDTESGRDKDTTFGGAIKDVLCIGIWDEERHEALIFPREVFTDTNRRMLGKLLMRNGMSAQNIKYDIGRVLNVFLGVDGVLDIPVKGDRMLQSYCLREIPGIHNLDYMAREYLGAPRWKHWVSESMEEGRRKAKAEVRARGEKIGDRFKGMDYSLVDKEVLYKYNAYDVGSARYLKDYFDPKLANTEGLTRLYQHLLDVTQMLVHVEQRGMMLDMDYNAQLEREYLEEKGSLTFSGTPDGFNPNSVQQVKKLFSDLGIELEDTRKNTLKGISDFYRVTGERDDIVDFCDTLLTHRDVTKTISTYIIGLRNSAIDGVVHPDYGLLSTSGRTRCRNPNAQNTPKGSRLRKQYRARPGKLYVHVDFGQNELRTMAWLAKDESLRSLFLQPGDMFWDLCLYVYGEEYASWSDDGRSKARQIVKTFVYGTAYGRGAKSIAVAMGISVARARQIQRKILAWMPGVVKYQQSIKEQACNGEDLITPFGRRRRFRLVTDLNMHEVCNEAMAFMPQSVANDICLLSAVRLDKQGVPIVNLIHDAIIAEVDISDVEETKHIMSKVMIDTAEEVAEHYVPWKVGIDVGESYGDFHD